MAVSSYEKRYKKRLDEVSVEQLNFMKKLGLKRITFGIENVDIDLLSSYGRRNISEEVQKKIISHCQKSGIQTQAFYMFGFPGDTVKNAVETIKYSLELDTTMASYKVLTPFPGTPFYDEIKDQIIEHDWEKFDGMTLTFKHPEFSPEQMEKLMKVAYSRFYMRPSQFLRYYGKGYLKHRDNKWLKIAEDWAEKKQKGFLEYF